MKLYGLLNLSSQNSSYTLGGSITGLNGSILIQSNLSENLTLNAEGTFTFTSRYLANTNYSLRIITQPSFQSCTITNSSGVVQNANVNNILITCINNVLTSLSLSTGSLNPNFSSTNLNYKFTVLNPTSSLSITPTNNLATSIIRVNGVSVLSGVTSNPISLNVGSNTITLLVIAENSATTTYTLTVIRSTFNAYRTFLTATTYTGSLIGTSSQGSLGADAKCEVDSNKPSDGSFYKAMVVDTVNRIACSTTADCTSQTENRDWVLKANTAYARVNGTPIFTTNTAGIFVFGTLTNSFGTGIFWSGLSTSSSWRTSTGGNHCAQWSSNSNALVGNYGDASATNSTSIANVAFNCDTFRSLLCVEQ
jgi:hypothetical protein